MNRRAFLKGCFAGAVGIGGLGLLASCSGGLYGSRRGGRPNILLIVADDMGYSDLECYGGEVKSPNLSRLAKNGLKFTQHYSTGRCWPSRTCLLTGYYAQQVRVDPMEGISKGKAPSWAPTVATMLKPYGYKSYHTGKWHLHGHGKPLQEGFDRAWGNQGNGCDDNRFFDSRKWVEGDYTAPVEEGQEYYSTIAIADHAVACLKMHEKEASDKPFFQYVAFYSPHFPLHALQDDIAKYKKVYHKGWDAVRKERYKKMTKMGLIDCELSERMDGITAPWSFSPERLKKEVHPGETAECMPWDDLNDVEKEYEATKMAIHAAMLHRMDISIGRIVDQVKAMGEFDNTLIMFVSDNGATSEQIVRGDKHDKNAPLGSAKSYMCLGPGWSTASNTPFRLHKHWNHEGGISSPLIAHWPNGIKDTNKLRHDPSHFINVTPTILELASGQPDPDNYKSADVPRRPGLSLIPAFEKDGSLKQENLWFCHAGNRAFRQSDWKISYNGAKTPKFIHNDPTKTPVPKWELYHIKTDRCEMNDLALKYPGKLEEMVGKWEAIAEDFRQGLKIK
jgi:arylsulfatase